MNMDLEYNREIKISEVSFPEEFIFLKHAEDLCLKTSINTNITVTPSGIEIILGEEYFIIERNNISNFSIGTYFSSERPSYHIPFYNIIINLKKGMKNTRFSITQDQIELFAYEKITSKLLIFFLIQEFSKMLNLPLKSLSDNKIDSNIPNFSNVDVEKNDSENLIIKRDSEYCPGNFIGVIIGFLYFLGMLIFFNGLIAYEAQQERSDVTFLFLLFGSCNAFIFCFWGYLLFEYYRRQGLHTAIDSFQIAISKLKFFTSQPTNPKIIDIDRNITLEIHKIEYSLQNMNKKNNNFQVVLYNLKKYKTVLMNKITLPEAEYIVKKILYLANRTNGDNINYCNDIKIIKRNPIFNIICFILLSLFINLGISYATVAITKTQLYTIKNPEILDHHVLRNLGYINVGSGRWQKKQKYIEVLNIPASYEYNGQRYYIKKIGDGCFKYSNELEKISIPTGVTSIGKEAFYCCLCLKLKIPDSVTEIGENAFRGVQHIVYYGNAKGAPWGTQSMN